MKNYHFKLILVFYVISIIVIFALGICISLAFRGVPNSEEITMKTLTYTFVAIAVLGVISIITTFISYKKMVEPMSRMLKSANPYQKLDYLESDDNDDLNGVISELRKDLLAANTQKLQTDTILKHMTDGVIAFNMDGDVTYINPAAKYMLELKDTDNTFDKIFSRYKNKDINMEKIIYLENWTSPEKKIINKQGTMNLFFVPFKDEINRPTGVMVVVQDITEHVKLNEMRKEFVADVSHELKTPLTSIKGFSETLLDGVDDKQTERHFLEIINDNADRMEKLVQDLLTLSKYDNQKATHNKVEFDLGDLAKRCAEKFEIEVKKKHQKLECLVTADVPKVYADIDGIERVIINIISNSVKYTPDGGRIDVYVGFVHNDAYVKIKDTGVGIPSKDLDRVFDRFYRVDKARTRKMGGTGLGLSIAKEIIEQNDGSISIKSEIGKGTEVVIKIPVSKQEKNESEVE